MTQYISQPIPSDRGAVRQMIVDSLAATIPGFVVPPASLFDFVLDQFASASAQDRQLLTETLASIFQYSGAKIDRTPKNAALPATGTTTWVRDPTDTASRLVSAGEQIAATAADGSVVAFETTLDFTFPLSTTTVAGVAVIASAPNPGTIGNGITGAAQPATTRTWLTSVTFTAPTSGGVDAEADDTYLNRLADTRPLRATTLLLPDDFGRFARNYQGVDRALILDNYNGAATQSGHLTAIPVDASGAALSSGAMTALLTAIQANTATNLVVHVQAPVYTTLTVVFAAKAAAGYSTSDVLTRAQNALLDLLSPSRWGLPQSGDQRGWVDTPIVRFQSLVTALRNVAGLDFYFAPTGTATTTNTSPNLTVVSPTTAGWVNKMPISGAGIPAGATIVSGAGTATMVMSANATASAAGVAITGTGLSVNGGTADVTMTGPGALPAAAPPTTVAGSVT